LGDFVGDMLSVNDLSNFKFFFPVIYY